MNEPVVESKKSCSILLLIGIILFDLTTFAFSIVIFAKANELLLPKGNGLIAFLGFIVYLCFLIPLLGYWIHSIIVALTYILSKYKNNFRIRIIYRSIALIFIGIASWFGSGAIKYYAIIPPFSYIIAFVLDVLRVKYYLKNQEENNNNYNQI